MSTSGHRNAAPTFARQSTLIPIAWSAAVTLAMLVVLVGPGWMRRPFTNTPIRRLGDLSYGIFLIHAVFIVYLASLFPGWATDPGPVETALFFAAVLGGSIVYAIGSRRLVEQPIARCASRPRAQPSTPSSLESSVEPQPGLESRSQ